MLFRSKLVHLLNAEAKNAILDPAWIAPELESAWKAHASRYKDLPHELKSVFSGVNTWLKLILKI